MDPDITCDATQTCDTRCTDDSDYCEKLCDEYCCSSGDDYYNSDGKISSCDSKNKFNSSQSSTYKQVGGSFRIGYGLGFADGFYGNDTVRLGNDANALAIQNQTFAQVDGIVPPLINAINQGLLDQPIFTVYLASKGSFWHHFGGLFTYGGLDTVNCGNVTGYVNLTSPTYYQFPMEGVSVGNYSTTNSKDAISDTGTSLIYGPTEIVDEIANRVGAEKVMGYYVVKCTKKYDPVTFTIGGQQYNLTYNVFNTSTIRGLEPVFVCYGRN
uniref:Peptidase A1 domain-containing protein n=1 Tax=Ditylenchus dipsaci TaxID=166011 RepID=A0A915CRJ7_9BILA